MFRSRNEFMDRIPRNITDNYSEEAVRDRIDWLRRKTGLPLEGIATYSIAPSDARGNIENFVGVAQVPIGLAGPLRINGNHAQGNFFVPLATTEGALVASYNRGMKVIGESGGANARILKDETCIGAIIDFGNLSEVIRFSHWVKENFSRLKEVAESTTHHGKLQSIESSIQGKRALLSFHYTTGDASGLNMITIASKAVIDLILKEVSVGRCVFPATFNDKKSTFMNAIKGRGKSVAADVTISRKLVEGVLHATPEEMMQGCYANSLMSATIGGTLSHNHHFANGLAALFIACGQDVAYVAESSVGSTVMDVSDSGDLYVSVTLPDLIAATMGGGTGLGTAKECLDMLGCYGTGKVQHFAEIIASVLLAGEVSMWGAIMSGEFSEAHRRYGRKQS